MLNRKIKNLFTFVLFFLIFTSPGIAHEVIMPSMHICKNDLIIKNKNLKFKKNETEHKKNYDFELSILAIFQNEAPYMKEWIEFHKLVGVQHFYLFNNLSDDKYFEVLSPYIENGEVDLIDWPYSFDSGETKDWQEIQVKAYAKGIQLANGKTKWLAIIDLDEFLIPVKQKKLTQILSNFEDAKIGGVFVNWQVYGTSFIPKIPHDKLLIETLLLKSSKDSKNDVTMVKTIVRPERVSKPKIHRCSFYEPFIAVNSDKTQCEQTSRQNVVIDQIRINHYWTRDEDYFFNVKVPCRVNRGWKVDVEFFNQTLNAKSDEVMLKFVPALRKKMGFDK